jgi:hypothetical protein
MSAMVSRPASFNSMSCEGGPFGCPQGRALRINCAAKAEAILLADMRQHFDVPALPSARRTQAPGAVATGTDPHHPADRLHSPLVPPAVDEREPHGR